MKKYGLVFIFCCAVSVLFSQTGRKQIIALSLGVDGGKATGSFSNTHSTGLGASAQLELGIIPFIHFTGYAGYQSFSGKTVQTQEGEFKHSSISQVPLLAGVRWYPLVKVFYLSGQLGNTILGRGNGSAFTYAPGVGIRVAGIDAMLRYMGVQKDGNSFSSTNLWVAFVF